MTSFVSFLFVTLLIASVRAASTVDYSPCGQLHLKSSYDVIVVGTGLGGSVAARRLAEWNPQWNVLTVERGIPYAACPGCRFSNNFTAYILDPASGGTITTTPQPGLNGQTVTIKDPAVQGGGTAVNGMFHVRGDADRYFDSVFPINWNFDSMIAFFERYENYSFPAGFHKGFWSYAADLRGNSGPLNASELVPTYNRTHWLDALQKVFPNMPVYYNLSLNDGFFPGRGAAVPEVTATGPTRNSAYNAYIQSYTGTNLQAITGTLVTKILFDSANEVTGVVVQLSDAMAAQLGIANRARQNCTLSTNKVVVSSGAFGTPKLLKLSGIGNPSELSSFHIPTVVNLPGVGENLIDHINVETILAAKSGTTIPFSTTSSNVYGSAYYDAADGGPNAQDNFIYQYITITPQIMANTVGGTNLQSRGYVRLASGNATASPIVNPNYFGIPSDRNNVALATFKSYNVSAQLGLYASPDPCSSNPCATPAQMLNAYINYTLIGAGYHFTSSAALCNVTNPVSLRVQGTRGLYVLDASILPDVPRANTMATLYAVSERGVDMINANMHSTYALQDVVEAEGWAICLVSQYI